MGLAAFPALDGGDTPSCTSVSPAPSSTPPSPSLESPPARAPEVDELSLVRTYFQSKSWWWPAMWCLAVGLVGFGRPAAAPREVSRHHGQWGSQKATWMGGRPGPHLYHRIAGPATESSRTSAGPWRFHGLTFIVLQNLEITCKHFPRNYTYTHSKNSSRCDSEKPNFLPYLTIAFSFPRAYHGY